MQNKGFVRVFAILLTLVCVFYLSFSFVTRHYTSKAKEFAKGDVKVEQDYLDSLANEKVYFGNWSLKQCLVECFVSLVVSQYFDDIGYGNFKDDVHTTLQVQT